MNKKLFLLATSALILGYSGSVIAAPAKASQSKIAPALERVYELSSASRAERLEGREAASKLADQRLLETLVYEGFVAIDAVAVSDVQALRADIVALGASRTSSYGRMVSARIPVARLADLAASEHLAFARPVLAKTNVGAVETQGDRSMGTDQVRTDPNLGFDGSGVTVGILSDSFACDPIVFPGESYKTPAEDVASGDIPDDVLILSDYNIRIACIDEGRGMAQLVHDVVPEAKISFHSAFNGEADFAEGIIELAEAGADVIVDDIIYFAEPMFQDGIVAQAADEVFRLGVPYYSSNGNGGRNSYEAPYMPYDDGDGIFHDFDPTAGVDTFLGVTISAGENNRMVLQWDSPYFSISGAPGSAADVDMLFYDDSGALLPDCSDSPSAPICRSVSVDEGVGQDPVEIINLVNATGAEADVSIALKTVAGTAPGYVKFIQFDAGFVDTEFAVDAPTGYGHSNAQGAEGVGAAAFYFTAAFTGDVSTLQLRQAVGELPCTPACLNDFSSAGGTPIFFDVAGNRLAEPEIRLKPGITGPDGGNTTFFIADTSRDDDDGDMIFEFQEPGEFPNFFGTSASAPHVAAVAAMMIDAENSQILTTTTRGLKVARMCDVAPGADRETGTDFTTFRAFVPSAISSGALLGPCDRTEANVIYEAKRQTAGDMTIRASNATGETIQMFDETGIRTFDFDSGFGFIDAKLAVEAFLNGTVEP